MIHLVLLLNILDQRVNRMPHVIYYASRTLTNSQKNYSTTKSDLLAVIFTLNKIRPYL